MTEVDREVREDIIEVVVRYATGIDRRDWARFRTCFTDDCEADYGDTGSWHGVDAITEFMEQTHAPLGDTMHRITNVAVEPNGDGATARSYVDALVLGPDNRGGAHAVGYYDDELVRTDDGWKIARRRFTSVLLEMLETGS